LYKSIQEIDIPDQADNGILKDEIIELYYGKVKKLVHTARRIAYWDEQKNKVPAFLTKNSDFTAEMVIEIYRRRWQIELLFKQLKQNFPLKYFLADNGNTIKMQIWTVMIANLLLMPVWSKVKCQWAFSNMTNLLREQLVCYILYSFVNDLEKT
jgi:IS4 transposase